ncbi:MAG TPA: pyruvate formate lyase family protein [Chthonomonadales bacterium]|nr:pyruvate formate lyase family protein [Chthonomonadales bacterium]
MPGKWLRAGEVSRHTLALQDARRFPASALWRARSYRETAGEPMTVRRALALNAVLASCDLPILPGEALLGSGTVRLAPDGPTAVLDRARDELAAIGGRHFGTHADHHCPDYPGLLSEGLGGLRRRASAERARREAAGEADRAAFLRSVQIALEGASRHVLRWAAEAHRVARQRGPYRQALRRQAVMLERLATRPASTFHEALQLVFLAHSILQLDDRNAMALGRLDQTLWPYYEADLGAGRLTADGARVLLHHLFAKLAHRGDVQNVAVGGLTPDGADATNELSTLIVEAVHAVGQPGGNLTARVHAGTPTEFLRACAACIRTGAGFPAMVNDGVMVPALHAQGYPLEEARDYCFVGCIESFIPGRQAPWADSRLNLLRCVDLALRDGRDGLTGEQAGPRTGEPTDWPAFGAAFEAQVRAAIEAHTEWVCSMERDADARAAELTSPLMSALTLDCIARGRDVNDGGARWQGCHGVAGMGIGSVADSLAAVRQFVYDRREIGLPELRAALDADFEGHEALRARLLNAAPKYGNDNEAVDALAVAAARVFGEALLQRRLPSGGRFWGLMAANVQNVSSGREVGATPDGRRAREPLSDAASPTFGRDVRGPTATVRSVAKLDYVLCPGGNVVNMKLHAPTLAGDRGLDAIASLVRTCFDLGGAQLQFNTTDRALLIEAMEHPERHRNLVVRVSGFSAYFVQLDPAVQADILARTEHRLA